MEFLMSYDYIALSIYIVISIVYISRKKLSLPTDRAFRLLLFVNIAAVVMEIFTDKSDMMPIGHTLTYEYTINLIYFVLQSASFMLISVYCAVLAKPNHDYSIPFIIAFLIPFLISVLVEITSPYTHWFFYIDNDLNYYIGTYYNLMQIPIFIYAGFALYFAVRYRKPLGSFMSKSMFVYAAILTIGEIVQALDNEMLLQNFDLALVTLILFTTIQSPDDIYEPHTNAYNRKAFNSTILSVSTAARTATDILLIHLDDFNSFAGSAGIDSSNHVSKNITDYVKSITSERVFSLRRNLLAVIFDSHNPKHGTVDSVIDAMRDRFTDSWNTGSLSTRLSVRFFNIVVPEDASDVHQVDRYINYVIESGSWDSDYMTAADLDLGDEERTSTIREAIVTALNNHSFQVYYQPIYSTKEGVFASAEALVRLHDLKLGFISPEEFIPIAEESGYIINIGTFVFRTVCQFMAEQKVLDYGVKYIEINLSVVQCMQDNLVHELHSIMDEYNIPPEAINLEITETATMTLPNVVNRNISELKQMGVSFSLDDFGTGYSNMLTLVNLPFVIIKIDKGIIWSAFKTKKGRTALHGTMSMINEMNLHTVAEGIETEEMVKELSDMGCTYLQGYYFSKPIPAAEYLEFIKKNNAEKSVIQDAWQNQPKGIN